MGVEQMKNLNPTLYKVIQEWGKSLSDDMNVKAVANSRNTLIHDKEAIVACLVKDFPKSYSQSYEVYKDLFSDIEIFNTYNELSEINVLVLGAGSGGDVFGFIQACDAFFSGKQIHIYSVEGNEQALISQINIFRSFIEPNLIGNSVTLIPMHLTLEKKFEELEPLLVEKFYKPLGSEKFDLIQMVKFMNEKSIRDKIKFVDVFHFMNEKLLPNRLAVILENADPNSIHKCDKDVSQKALREFLIYCKKKLKSNQLYALTPTPCIARRLTGLSRQQCVRCLTCYDEINVLVARDEDNPNGIEATNVFLMKIVTGPLGEKIANSLQDDSVGYKTMSMSGKISDKYCTLNAKVEADSYANAFKICQEIED